MYIPHSIEFHFQWFDLCAFFSYPACMPIRSVFQMWLIFHIVFHFNELMHTVILLLSIYANREKISAFRIDDGSGYMRWNEPLIKLMITWGEIKKSKTGRTRQPNRIVIEHRIVYHQNSMIHTKFGGKFALFQYVSPWNFAHTQREPDTMTKLKIWNENRNRKVSMNKNTNAMGVSLYYVHDDVARCSRLHTIEKWREKNGTRIWRMWNHSSGVLHKTTKQTYNILNLSTQERWRIAVSIK